MFNSRIALTAVSIILAGFMRDVLALSARPCLSGSLSELCVEHLLCRQMAAAIVAAFAVPLSGAEQKELTLTLH